MGTRVNGVSLDAGTSGPAVPDPTGAPDGQVVTTASGALVLATPSGGPAIPGAPSADAMTGTGWTTTTGGSVTATWGSGKLTIDAPTATVAITKVRQDTSPLGATAAVWEVCARIDVAAGDGISPRGMFGVGFQLDASNEIHVVLLSDRKVGCFSRAAGAFVDHGFAAGPSSGQATGGQLWLRLTRLLDGRFVTWWGVGTAGAVPTAWTRQAVIDRAALSPALGGATLHMYSGWFGEGAIPSAWTIDVLAIRSSWRGEL